MTAMPVAYDGPVDELGTDVIASIRGLTKIYGTTVAVKDVDLDIPVGSMFGLVGPNGAGKSTIMSVMVGLLRPTSGNVRVCGHDPTAESDEVRRQVGYMPDVLGFHEGILVSEYISFFAAANRIPRAERPGLVDNLLELVDLTGRADSRVDALSRGLKQRLNLARALVNDPKLLVLDEPASGLDPRARVELRDTLELLRDMGKTVVISSHILGELENMCSDLAVISNGAVKASGRSDDLLKASIGARRVRVRLAGGEMREYSATGDADQAALLRRLVIDEGLPVTEIASSGSDLERIFLELTTETAAPNVGPMPPPVPPASSGSPQPSSGMTPPPAVPPAHPGAASPVTQPPPPPNSPGGIS